MLPISTRRLYLWIALLVYAIFTLTVLALKASSRPYYSDHTDYSDDTGASIDVDVNGTTLSLAPTWVSASQATATLAIAITAFLLSILGAIFVFIIWSKDTKVDLSLPLEEKILIPATDLPTHPDPRLPLCHFSHSNSHPLDSDHNFQPPPRVLPHRPRRRRHSIRSSSICSILEALRRRPIRSWNLDLWCLKIKSKYWRDIHRIRSQLWDSVRYWSYSSMAGAHLDFWELGDDVVCLDNRAWRDWEYGESSKIEGRCEDGLYWAQRKLLIMLKIISFSTSVRWRWISSKDVWAVQVSNTLWVA